MRMGTLLGSAAARSPDAGHGRKISSGRKETPGNRLRGFATSRSARTISTWRRPGHHWGVGNGAFSFRERFWRHAEPKEARQPRALSYGRGNLRNARLRGIRTSLHFVMGDWAH